MAHVHPSVLAARPILGFLSATASGAAFVAALYVYGGDADSDATVFLTGSRLGDDAVGFGAFWLVGWIALTLLACVPFTVLFRLGRRAGVLGLPYSLITGAATSASIYLLVLFLILAMPPAQSSDVGFLLEGSVLPQLFVIAVAAGLIGGVTFWWVGCRRA